jgi:hypothetical protein
MSLCVLPFRFIVLGAALLAATTALAQPRNPMQQMRPTQVKPVGTLVAVSGNQIQMSTNTNQTIYVTFTPETKVSVTGKAEQDYLKSSVAVEFVAEVDKTHTVTEKISQLTVVSQPTPDRPAGLLSPDAATPTKKSEKGGKAAKADADKADPFAADPTAGKPAKGRSSTPQFPATYTVRGTIKMCKDGKITVAAGRGPTIKAELASDVSINVSMNDLRAVQRDDKVTVEGFATPARPNMVMAKSIDIELANPLTGAKKHSTRPAKTPAAPASKAKKGSADADDLPDPGSK